MIVVGKKSESGAVYIGRGSPLGNPFIIGKDGDRDSVCDQYDQWIEERLQERDPQVIAELERLERIKQENGGNLILGCFCCHSTDKIQLRCHGHTVKRILESTGIQQQS